MALVDGYSLLRRLSDMHITPSLPAIQAEETVPTDPLIVREEDLERRCLGTLTEALRAIISYAHSSFRVPISFQVKRFDRAHGQIWVKVNPEEVPEGYDLKYLLQHMKFYENMPRYAELLCVQDYQLRSTCQYFLDLQSRAAATKTEESSVEGSDLSRVKETVARTTAWVQQMSSVGLSDREVVHQLKVTQSKLSAISDTVQKYSTFQQNRSEAVRRMSSWYPERHEMAARSVHAQMLQLMGDPEVVKYILHVVGPRLGITPFRLP